MARSSIATLARARVLPARHAREPVVPVHAGGSLEALVEGFNLTNHNVITRNTNFGAGAYPTEPSADVRTVTAVGEPRSVQFGIRVRF